MPFIRVWNYWMGITYLVLSWVCIISDNPFAQGPLQRKGGNLQSENLQTCVAGC